MSTQVDEQQYLPVAVEVCYDISKDAVSLLRLGRASSATVLSISEDSMLRRSSSANKPAAYCD